jgi:CBS domain-containing protein
MQVHDVMTKEVQCCVPDDSLERAARYMWDRDCGSLPVCQTASDGDYRTIGMITDRDICMCALFQGRPLAELRVSDAMTKKVISCQPNDELTQAERLMREQRIRRLPVTDAGSGRLQGVISLADVARVATHETNVGIRQQAEMEVCDTLVSICTPRMPAQLHS